MERTKSKISIGILLLLISSSIWSQVNYPLSPYLIYEKNGYTIGFCEINKQAGWVQYLLTKDDVINGKVERTNDFRNDFNVKKSATLSDFRGSGYDRGHLCPAGDRKKNKELMSETFLLSNMSPQLPGFNRGIWGRLENLIRDIAIKEDSIIVITGPIFQNNKGVIGNNAVTVPGYYYKVILDLTGKMKAIGFVLEHASNSTRNLFEFAVSVDLIESYTGIDFFPGIFNEENIEQDLNINHWH